MKKFLVALMAVMAIALTSCKHESCNLYITNNYNKSAIVLLSHDKECRSIKEAEIVCRAEAGKAYKVTEKVKLNGLYAITFVCDLETAENDGTLEHFTFQHCDDLNEYVGMANVNIIIDAKGFPGISADTL